MSNLEARESNPCPLPQAQIRRDQLKRAANLTEEDLVQLGRCRRAHNRLGFAY
jgi:hypothetical protein